MRDRVFVSKDKTDLFIKLSRTKHQNRHWLFDNNKDLFLFALAIGWNHQLSLPLEKRDIEIPLSIFQKSSDNIDFIDLVALGTTKDVYILDWDDEKRVEEKLSIVEMYANGGLEIINDKLFNNNTDIYDNLLQLVHYESSNKHTTEITDLKNIVDLI